MRKNIKILLLAILILVASATIIGLVGCKPNTESCSHKWTDWTSDKDGHRQVCSVCNAQNSKFEHSFGDYKEENGEVIHTCNQCGYAENLYREVNVKDENTNIRLSNEINARLNTFAEKVKSSNYMSFYLEIYGYGTYVSQYIKTSNEPLYIELVSPEYGDNPIVIKEENGKLYSYVNKGYSYAHYRDVVQRTCIGMANDETVELPNINKDININNSVAFKTNACNITFEDGVYTVDTLLKDLVPNESTQQIKEMFDQLGVSSQIIDYATVKIKISTTYVEAYINCAVTLNLFANDTLIPVTVTTAQTVNLDVFEPIDFNSGSYYIPNPTTIDDVYETTDITHPIDCDGKINVYKVELEKGAYAFEANFTSAEITSAKDMQNTIYVGDKSKEPYAINYYSKFFTVETAGEYYLTVYDDKITEGWDYTQFSLIKLNYETIVDINNPLQLKETVTGTIEGRYDLDCYGYIAENETDITITNVGDCDVSVICLRNGQLSQLSLKVGESLEIPVSEGSNKIFIACDYDQDQVCNYKLTLAC